MSDMSSGSAMPEYRARKTAIVVQVFGAIVIAIGIIVALVGLY